MGDKAISGLVTNTYIKVKGVKIINSMISNTFHPAPITIDTF